MSAAHGREAPTPPASPTAHLSAGGGARGVRAAACLVGARAAPALGVREAQQPGGARAARCRLDNGPPGVQCATMHSCVAHQERKLRPQRRWQKARGKPGEGSARQQHASGQNARQQHARQQHVRQQAWKRREGRRQCSTRVWRGAIGDSSACQTFVKCNPCRRAVRAGGEGAAGLEAAGQEARGALPLYSRKAGAAAGRGMHDTHGGRGCLCVHCTAGSHPPRYPGTRCA